MKFYPERVYHVYNRANNSHSVFLKRDHYLFFLTKMRSHLLEHCDILAYCLMPNQFHMLIYTKKSDGNQRLLSLSRAFGAMLSSFTRTINQDQKRIGSLFQQQTKAKELGEETGGTRPTTLSLRTSKDFYPLTCFHYIHQNPVKTGLVDKLNDWEFCSFPDYAGFRNGTLCNQTLARQLLELPESREQFCLESYAMIDKTMVEKLFV